MAKSLPRNRDFRGWDAEDATVDPPDVVPTLGSLGTPQDADVPATLFRTSINMHTLIRFYLHYSPYA